MENVSAASVDDGATAVDARSLPATKRDELIRSQLRRLVHACDAREQHCNAAWYANKLVTLSQQAVQDTGQDPEVLSSFLEDVALLARAYIRNGEFQRAFAAIEVQGLLDMDKHTLADAQRSRAFTAALTSGGDTPIGPATTCRSDILPLVYLAAIALKQSKQHERALQLLESAMEGVGLPPLVVPLRPKDDGPSDPDDDGFATRRFPGHENPMVHDALMEATSVRMSSGNLLKRLRVSSPPDVNFTWRLVKLMAVHHSDTTIEAPGSARGRSERDIAAASPVFTKTTLPVPFSDGSEINIISSLCELRAECLMLANNRQRATQWFIAAVRTDPYNVAALQALIDNHLLTDDEESKLSSYISAMLALPVVVSTHQHDLHADGPREARVNSMDSIRTTSTAVTGSVMNVPSPQRSVDARVPEKRGVKGSLLRAPPGVHSPPRIRQEHHTTGGIKPSGLRNEITTEDVSAAARRGSVEETVATQSPGRAADLASVAAVASVTLDLGWLDALLRMRLNRYSVSIPIPLKFHALESEYRLGGNSDVLAAKCEVLAYQHDAAASYALSRKLIAFDAHDCRVIALHIANLLQLGKSAELFQLGHAAVKAAPKDALAWYAVGCYYLLVSKSQAAVKYFAKATQLDAAHALAWVGLGQAYAQLHEYEPALHAYRAAMTLHPRAHMPPLAMAAIASRAGQLVLAKQYLELAIARCPTDPLVYHEAGVLEYKSGQYSKAWGLFTFALDLVSDCPFHIRKAWEPTMFCMGHTCRKLGQYETAIQWYEKCLSVNPNSQSTLAALAFAYHLNGNYDQAISLYHAALSLDPDDGISSALVTLAAHDMYDGSSVMQLLNSTHTADERAVRRAEATKRGASYAPDNVVEVMSPINESNAMAESPSELRRSGMEMDDSSGEM